MKSIDYLKKYYPQNELKNNIIPLLVENGKKEQVPNVKFSICEVLSSLVKFLGNDSKIKKISEDYMTSLFNDKDEDVSFFSKKAFENLKN